MQKDANRIELNVRKGVYEEFVLQASTPSNPQGLCLPGSIVAMTDAEQKHIVNTVHSEATNIEGFETIVILENALLGKGINAASYDGEQILCRRVVSGDLYLLRCVPDTYKFGQPVYATQTPNGIYVSREGEGKFIGWAQENFECTPDMVDLVDASTRDMPQRDPNLNGAIVNLLRVRIGSRKKSAPVVPISKFSVTPIPTSLDPTGILITFIENPLAPILGPLALSEISISGGIVPTSVTQTGPLTFEVSAPLTTAGTYQVTITKTNVTTKPVSFTFTKTPPPPVPTGWMGIWYPDSTATPLVPTFPSFDGDAAVAFTGTTEITGSVRTLDLTVDANVTDWNAIQPSPPVPFATWVNVGVRGFILVKGTAWGTITAWDGTGTFPYTAWTPISAVIGGVTYNGLLSNDIAGVTPVKFKFT